MRKNEDMYECMLAEKWLKLMRNKSSAVRINFGLHYTLQ